MSTKNQPTQLDSRWRNNSPDKNAQQRALSILQARHIEKGIKGLAGLKDAAIGYIPPSGRGCRYHTLGLQLSFRKSDEEVSEIVRSLREDDPEIWVRYWGQGTGFIINTLNLLPGDEDTIVERFKKIFG